MYVLFVEKDTQMKDIFPDLERFLSASRASLGAAESHGLLCARYCIQASPDFEVWVDEVLGDYDTADLSVSECRQQLSRVYQITDRYFDESLNGLELLLPDDDSPLQLRGYTLINWCDGFIAGLGLSGLQANEQLEPEIQEILRDLIEITQLEKQIEEGEENEQAYVEIVEYIRVAVMTLGLSLRNRDPSKTLH